jgi:hypothetical protein
MLRYDHMCVLRPPKDGSLVTSTYLTFTGVCGRYPKTTRFLVEVIQFTIE